MIKRKKKKNKNILTNLKEGLITKKNPKSPISEQYRTLRTNIEYSMMTQQLRTLICTSADPSEGKTTTLSNLAVTFAQNGKRILFVDADLRKPTAHYAFSVENQFGLISVLTKKKSLEEAAVSTDIENLYILPSGPLPPNPSELLGSPAMEELIAEMIGSFDIVLFDTPPVGIVTDAQVLGHLCDGALLVARSNQTEKGALLKAKELLKQLDIKIIGVVMNDISGKESGYHYRQYGNS